MADVYVTDSQNQQYPVMKGDLLIPLVGNWTSQLDFGGIEIVPTGQVTLTWYDTNFMGYIVRSGVSDGIGTATLAGGAGGLWKQNPTKLYNYNVQAQLPFSEILADCGEKISENADTTKLTPLLTSWIRRETTAGQQVMDLIEHLGTYWSVSPDGGIYVGDYSWPTADKSAYTLQKHDPSLYYSWFNTIGASILPGQTIEVHQTAYKIAAAHYKLSSTGAIAQFWYLDSRAEKLTLDPLHQGLKQFILETISQLDYYAMYPGKVVVQREDGTIDIILDNPRLPPLTSVPIRLPWPGAKINVMPNTRVLVSFEDADPTQFSAQLWQTGQGGLPMARKTDSTNSGTLAMTATGVTASFIYTDPNGSAVTIGTILLPVPGPMFGTPGLVTPGPIANIDGLITSGSPTIEDAT